MQNALKTHSKEIDGNAQRQYIDAKSVLQRLRKRRKMLPKSGETMLWKTQNGFKAIIVRNYMQSFSVSERSADGVVLRALASWNRVRSDGCLRPVDYSCNR
jgi:hypothetical protein